MFRLAPTVCDQPDAPTSLPRTLRYSPAPSALPPGKRPRSCEQNRIPRGLQPLFHRFWVEKRLAFLCGDVPALGALPGPFRPRSPTVTSSGEIFKTFVKQKTRRCGDPDIGRGRVGGAPLSNISLRLRRQQEVLPVPAHPSSCCSQHRLLPAPLSPSSTAGVLSFQMSGEAARSAPLERRCGAPA